ERERGLARRREVERAALPQARLILVARGLRRERTRRNEQHDAAGDGPDRPRQEGSHDLKSSVVGAGGRRQAVPATPPVSLSRLEPPLHSETDLSRLVEEVARERVELRAVPARDERRDRRELLL